MNAKMTKLHQHRHFMQYPPTSSRATTLVAYASVCDLNGANKRRTLYHAPVMARRPDSSKLEKLTLRDLNDLR